MKNRNFKTSNFQSTGRRNLKGKCQYCHGVIKTDSSAVSYKPDSSVYCTGIEHKRTWIRKFES